MQPLAYDNDISNKKSMEDRVDNSNLNTKIYAGSNKTVRRTATQDPRLSGQQR